MAANGLNADLELTVINHWQVAIDTHTANHEYAKHLCTGLDSITDPRKLVKADKNGVHRLNIMTASPECTHHSTARGGKPMNDQSRHSGWHILRFAEALYIDNIIIENVPEYESWGPIGADGRPLKSRKGELFLQLINSFKALDYNVEWRTLVCANYGDPTTRKRLFIICRRGGKKIVWPEPTHVKPTKNTSLFAETRPAWRTAREIIDWNLESRSIFGRKKPLADKTLIRIEAGLKKFCGLDVDLRRCMVEKLQPFLVVMRGTGTTSDVNAPLPALTAGGQHLGLVTPYMMQIDQTGRGAASVRSVDRPIATLVTKANTAVVTPLVVQTDQTGSNGICVRPVDEPMPTMLTSANVGVAEPELQAMVMGQQSGATARSVDEPVPAVAGAGAVSLLQPCIIPQFSENGPRDIDRPLGTVTTTSRDVGLAQPFITTAGGTEGQGRQPHSLDETLGTVLTNDRRAIADPFFVPQFGERAGQKPRTHSIDKPVPAATSHGAGALVESFMVTVNHGDGDTTRRARSLDVPMPTTTSKIGDGLCESFLIAYYGTQNMSETGEPLPTVTVKDRFGLVEIDTDKHDLYRLDIRFRMLQPKELAAAQGFPSDYKFTGNREAVVKQIGNAVPPNTARALCAAVLDDGKPWRAAKQTTPPTAEEIEEMEHELIVEHGWTVGEDGELTDEVLA